MNDNASAKNNFIHLTIRSMLGIYNPIFYFLITPLLLLFIAMPVFSGADSSWHASSQRTSTLDGLRGFLAISVFFHHSSIYHEYLIHGNWALPPSNFFTQLGQASVSLFFMITGFLFWRNVIQKDGKKSWFKFYINRFFRIAPLYYLATALMLFIIFQKSGFVLLASTRSLFDSVFPLLLAGFYGTGPSINGYQDPWIILAGVTWTLRFEWIFYLIILPIAAALGGKNTRHLLFSGCGFILFAIIAGKYTAMPPIALLEFWAGMLCASLQNRAQPFRIRPANNTYFSLATISLLALLMTFNTAYQVLPVLILSFVFFFIVSGCTIFGLLHLRTSRRLGELSFGIYLLQGLALYFVFSFHEVRIYAMQSIPIYWSIITFCGMLLVTFAYYAHRYIELPGIAFGKHLNQRNKTTPAVTVAPL